MADEQHLPAVEGAGEQPAPAAVEPEDAARKGDLVAAELEELQAKAAERDEYLALAQRTQADFENFRKRMAREAQGAREKGARQVAEALLPALDNLERALDAVEAQEDEAGEEHHLTKGIRLVQNELAAALARVGVEAFSPHGETFDPNEHEAVGQAPIEGAASGTVAEVLQQGYRLNGSLIRPARVMVAG